MVTTVIRGSCLCGAVGFEAHPPVTTFVGCWCSRCRKASGSVQAMNVYVPPEAFRWTRGEDLVIRFDLPAARSFSTAFCGRCGAPMPHATRSGREVIIPAGALDDDPGARPSAALHWRSRAAWAPATIDLPTPEA